MHPIFKLLYFLGGNIYPEDKLQNKTEVKRPFKNPLILDDL